MTIYIDCCKATKNNKKCMRKTDKKIFKLPRKFSKKKCADKKKGFTFRSSCAPYKDCFKFTGRTTKKNILNKPLKICSTKPLTGYNRDGYCSAHKHDKGKHYVCAKLSKKFLDFTSSKGNNLNNVLSPNDKWCLCQERWLEAYHKNKHPNVIKSATNQKTRKQIKDIILKKKSISRFLYNPDNPKKSFDVYVDKNPSDTISIKYSTIKEVQETIKKLEHLYKTNKYSHKRIWQVGMILKVRLEAILKHKNTLYKKAKYVKERYNLAYKYFKFLSKRTKQPNEKLRKQMLFV
jgi:uncharacterized protein (DUF2237 family)